MKLNKILFLTDSLSNGGAERQLALLIENLPSSVKANVWSMGDGIFKSVIENLGIQVKVVERSWRWDILPAFDLWKTISNFRPDIIHAFGYMSALAALPVAKFYQIPIVNSTIRLGIIPPKRGKIMKFLLRYADRVISNSKAGLKAFEVSSTKGLVIPNGFSPSRFALINSLSDQKEPEFTVIMVARMHKDKDFEAFFEAAKNLINHNYHFKFLVLGNGPTRKYLIDRYQREILEGIFHFPPPTLEVIPYIKKSHVGVLLTNLRFHAEGISNAIMEYMACGLPVVCSDCGGNRELVINEKTGFLIKTGNLSDLEDKLIFLFNNYEIAKQMGEAGKKRIRNNFSTDQMTQKTISVYKDLLKK